MATSKDNPYDIDGSNFNSEMYLDRLLRMGNLKQIMDKECEIISQSQNLHSEMQTLVYENYNKFISATDTVRKMRSDFKHMQSEMQQLNDNMDKILLFSNKISSNLKESGSNVSRLCATRQLLDRLQFLFLLPSQLNKCISDGHYADAVRDYVLAQRVLIQYGGQPSFQSIQSECEDIVNRLKVTLKEQLLNPETTATHLAESARLLVQLQDSYDSLDETFLTCAQAKMLQHLQSLDCVLDCSDIIEWVEKSHTGLLVDLKIIIMSYNEIFLEQKRNEKQSEAILIFADEVFTKYFELARKFLISSTNGGTEMVIRGLDQFYNNLQRITDIINNDNVQREASNIVIECIALKGDVHYNSIRAQFKENLGKVRQSLSAKVGDCTDLKEILHSLQIFLLEKVQASLQDLMDFLQKDLSFSLQPWCINSVFDSCWRLITQTLANVGEIVKAFSISQATNNNTPLELLLILAKLCLELQDNGVTSLHTYMLKLMEKAVPGEHLGKKDSGEVTVVLATAAQAALDAEVVFVGQSAAQMLRVSVLARDWLRAPEPRGPRAVCRRVVEALAAADTAAAQLFPMGNRQSSDSSRRTLWPRAPSSFTPVNRIFSERIEVFGPAGADRVALSAGALKVALKALVECVRLRTFGRHGLQQLQVDVHFLQQRLSCLGNDERLLSALLDDTLASAQLRCVDPQLMEPSIVDVICERG